MLQNEILLANIAADTAEQGPQFANIDYKIYQMLAQNAPAEISEPCNGKHLVREHAVHPVAVQPVAQGAQQGAVPAAPGLGAEAEDRGERARHGQRSGAR